MGVDFVRRFTPQAFVLTGLLAYNPPPSNSNTRASTVNGVKIIFMNINSFDSLRSSSTTTRWIV